MLHEARENAKMSTQLEKLQKRLEQEAAARELLERERDASLMAERANMEKELRKEREAFMSETSAVASSQGREELEALGHLQAELAKLRGRVEQLTDENSNMRLRLQGDIKEMDMKAGEVAMGRILLEDKDRYLEREKAMVIKLNQQFAVEKKVLIDMHNELCTEIDEVHHMYELTHRRFVAEREMRKKQHQATVDFLSARGVSKKTLDELTSFVALSLSSESFDPALSEWEASFLAVAESQEYGSKGGRKRLGAGLGGKKNSSRRKKRDGSGGGGGGDNQSTSSPSPSHNSPSPKDNRHSITENNLYLKNGNAATPAGSNAPYFASPTPHGKGGGNGARGAGAGETWQDASSPVRASPNNVLTSSPASPMGYTHTHEADRGRDSESRRRPSGKSRAKSISPSDPVVAGAAVGQDGDKNWFFIPGVF